LLDHHLLSHALQLLAKIILHFSIFFIELSFEIVHLFSDDQDFIRHIDKLPIKNLMQIIIDQIHNQIGHLIDHFLTLHWKIVLANRPRIFSCFLKSKSWQFRWFDSIISTIPNETANFRNKFLIF